MKKKLQTVLLAWLAVALSAGSVLAGRGGSGGHGGGSSGSASSHGGGHGGSIAMSRSSTGHTPSFNAPRTGIRPASMPQHFRPPNPVNRPTFANRPKPVSHPSTYPRVDPRPADHAPRQDWAHHDWYHGSWHGHWDHPWNSWPYTWFNAEVGWDLAAATPWSWGYWPYYNPYCTAPVVVEGGTIDYSQPIAAAVPPEALANPTSPADEAALVLDAARDAFLRGDYPAALSQVNQAIARNPNDPLSHEFRCLVCFALKQYEEAAAGAYAVLSVGPGWDWTTLSSFYPNVDVYAQQLHALEEYIDAHSNQPDVRFLLAYHYLTCGHTDAAAQQLKAVVQLNPRDQLSTQLLAALAAPSRKFVLPETKKLAAQLDDLLAATQGGYLAEPNAAAAPTKPLDAVSLVGDWKARQPDGSTVALRLTSNWTYTWWFTRQGKSQDHSGTYALTDNLLILKEGNTPVMVGRVALLGDNRLNFKLVNDNPSDPGLTFSR
jgi:hypothetical protein